MILVYEKNVRLGVLSKPYFDSARNALCIPVQTPSMGVLEALRVWCNAVVSKMLDIKPVRTRRTLDQNAYFHVVLQKWSDHNGDDMQSQKDYWKFEAVKAGVLQPQRQYEGEEGKYIVLPETKRMNKETMSRFIDWLLMRLAKEGWEAPTWEQAEHVYEVER